MKKIYQKSIGKRLWLNALMTTSVLGLGVVTLPSTTLADSNTNAVQVMTANNKKAKEVNVSATVTDNDDGSQTIKINLPANQVNINGQKLYYVATDNDNASTDDSNVDSGKAHQNADNDNLSFKVNLSATALKNNTLMTDPLKITLTNAKGDEIASIDGITLEQLQDLAKGKTNSSNTSAVTDSSSNASSASNVNNMDPNSASNGTTSTASLSSDAESTSSNARNNSMDPNSSTKHSRVSNANASSTASQPAQASSSATPATSNSASSAASAANMNPNAENSTSTPASSSSASAASSTPSSASNANSSSSPNSEAADQALPQTGNGQQFYLTLAGAAILAGILGTYVGMRTRKK